MAPAAVLVTALLCLADVGGKHKHDGSGAVSVKSGEPAHVHKPKPQKLPHEDKAKDEGASALPPPPPDFAPASASGIGGGFGAGISLLCLMGLLAVAGSVYAKEIMAMSTNLSSWGLQIGSFFVLTVVQAGAITLFRICQSSGAYEFSPASSVALTEICKLGLAVTLHARYVSQSGAEPFAGLSPRIVLHYFGLALCYTVNNQLTFYCLQMVDPGSFALGKSLAPYLVAVLLRFTGQLLNQLQWVCIVLQCICLAITQYNACKESAVLTPEAYAMLGVAVGITAVSSVWNQKVVKGFDVPVNLQNALLYTFGTVIALISYVAIPDPSHPHGFFHGYSLLAIFLVVFQAFHGLAVTLVYKYADAIVKNFANSAVMAILVFVSAYAFNAPTSLTAYLGVAAVLVTTYAYMNIALRM